jgi:hydroxyethylthiazole kinase-like uncharacterized protein yjeF
MKIFSAKQIYEADRSTIEKQQIGSDALMERASLQLFQWIHRKLKGAQPIIRLFCGTGNNGGDGLALARHLYDHGYSIVVYVVNYSDKRSDDFLLNLDRLKERKIWPEVINKDSGLPEIGQGDILVDAIFGIGLNRPPAPWVGSLIEKLNASGAFIISVDVPSGLYTDLDTGHKQAIRANMVLSFQLPKLIFFLPVSGAYSEQFELLDIGLDAEYLEQTETDYELIGKKEALRFYRPRNKFSHKGTFGHSLIIGGSYGKTGAIQLSSRACLKSGSGLVTAYVPRCGYLPLQTALPEVMVLTDPGEEHITSLDVQLPANAIGIGIGLGTAEQTSTAFSDFLEVHRAPLVVDADALNILAKRKELLRKLPSRTVLTPHPGELKRLIGPWEGDFDKLKKAHAFSKEFDCILLIKGAHTITLYGGKGYVNNTGNPGMASAGSGDVLTGIITGLISQGYPPLEAAVFGAYLHGRAGDMAAVRCGYESLVAGEIIDSLGLAFLELIMGEEETPGGANNSG